MASSGKNRSRSHRATTPAAATGAQQQGFQVTRQVLNILDNIAGSYCYGRRNVNLGEIGFMELRTWAQTRYEQGENARTGTKGQQNREQQREKTMAAGGGNA
jgi:hypothetical protein